MGRVGGQFVYSLAGHFQNSGLHSEQDGSYKRGMSRRITWPGSSFNKIPLRLFCCKYSERMETEKLGFIIKVLRHNAYYHC